MVLDAPQQSLNEHSLPRHKLIIAFFLWYLSSANVLRFLLQCARFLLGASPDSAYQKEQHVV